MTASERQRRWRRENRERAEATRKAYAAKPETKQRRRAIYREGNPYPPPREKPQIDWRTRNYARCLFLRCRSAAKRKGIAFDLTPEDVQAVVAPMVCSVTGAKLTIAPQGERAALLPSIDQREPGKGYTRANIRLVSWIYNRAKAAGTDREVLEMALALVTQSSMQTII